MKKYQCLIAGILVIMAPFLLGCSFNAPGESSKASEAYFCPEDDCFGIIASYIRNASKADCALYTLNSAGIENALKETESRIVSDGKCINGIECKPKPPYNRGLMHNKFCILDDSIVITGSFNPNEKSGGYLNNVVVLHSKVLAEAYSKEFEELFSGKFGAGKKGSASAVLNGSRAEAYFCPEDNCQTHLLEEIGTAEKSVYFMVYSFTDNEIANELLGKTKEGVVVKGFFDKSQNTKWSVYPKLENKAGVWVYGNGVMHNKVFIIDNETVITGSYNPTQNGNENNDENMVVMHDRAIAEKFAEYFSGLRNAYKQP
ncbi:MAG TPA: hypothetical protein HA362_01930 [Nanoarchaeota archaeon]|nr:hypothetical protein [Nanoarchaeota archaeon]